MADPYGYHVIEGSPDEDERNTEQRARAFVRERERITREARREPVKPKPVIKSRWDIP